MLSNISKFESSSGTDPVPANRQYTADVVTEETLHYRFDNLFLAPPLVAGLRACGYVRPSPVQLHAIPTAKFGTDLIVQAKAGTGKTLVFTIVILESIRIDDDRNRHHHPGSGGDEAAAAAAAAAAGDGGGGSFPQLQAVVVAPTREITLQIADVMRNVGQEFPGLRVASFIGGVSQKEDRQAIKNGCHVATGSPGRLYHLIRDRALDVSCVRIVVLDEADKVTEGVFHQTVSHILAALPPRKQVMAFSATYSSRLNALLSEFTTSPHVLRVDDSGQVSDQLVTVSRTAHKQQSGEEVFPALHGVHQLVHVMSSMPASGAKRRSTSPPPSHGGSSAQDVLPRDAEDPVLELMVERLLAILLTINFKQCMVFCNDRRDTEAVSERLQAHHHSAAFISAHIPQSDRLVALGKFRSGEVRVLVTSDLTARGIDVATVDLVVNLGLPRDAATYMHRVGRAGRFGSQGHAVSIVRARDQGRVAALEKIQGLRMRRLELPGVESPESGLDVERSVDPIELDRLAATRCSAPHCPDADSTEHLNDCASPVETDVSDLKTENLPSTARLIAKEIATYQSWVSQLCHNSTPQSSSKRPQ